MPLPHSLRAFRHRDYRLYFAGQGISQTGTWLQLIATSWLVYDLSGSAFLLGLAAFAQQIPLLVLSPFAGVWVDRMRKRKVLLMTQNGALAQSLVMLALVALGQVQPWHLIAANLVLGILNAVDSPVPQAQLVELVGGREDLPNAIAYSSVLMNGARFIGPMIGGAVIAGFGEVWGFGLNSIMRGAVIAALLLIRAVPRPTEKSASGWLEQLAAGFRYAYGFLPTRSALLLLSAVSFA
ncbi:MAG: MFS transporter, partial [Terriglobales bacterium]